ncbi:mRNA-capping enzyme subunit beta [Aspergillus nanangensis]|uniref:mRNA-capping enzyme subunit beta n=1 Tax=Aspergillus nanangensis TaxID=2582783 RepID=A0AAD4CLN0_ASPNN|nr:mRNA-capping enzyme subunit beta [Aspergillus nanangensis]
MDLRTIMNTDAAGTAAPPPQSSSQPSRNLSDATYAPVAQKPSKASYPSSDYPPQPPPLQQPQVTPDRSSSYGSLQSPYQYQPSSTFSAGAQSQRVPSPPPPLPPPPPYGSSSKRDAYGTSTAYNSSTPQKRQSPYTQPRSLSTQSVAFPYSSSTHSFHSRESPTAAAPMSYPSQHFSPTTQPSMPGTPRGSIAPPFPRNASPSSARPPSSGHDSLSNRASSPWVGSDAPTHMSPTTFHRSSRQEPRPDQPPRLHSVGAERRDSDDSVSPKTAYPPGSRHDSAAGHLDAKALHPSNHIENGADSKERRSSGLEPHTMPASSNPVNSSPPARRSRSNETPPMDQGHPIPSKVSQDAKMSSSPHQPRVKRRRYNEPPVFALMAERTKGRCPKIPNRLPPVPKHARYSAQNPWISRQRCQTSTHSATPDRAIKTKAASSPVNGPPIPQAVPEPSQAGSLGPWEPSITGFIPHEELTKTVCDFLFQNVVLRNDVVAAPAGTAAAGHGAIIEVEAKLGRIIDMDRGERLQLPISSESILNKENSRFRTAFESSMSLAQHRAMNNFLNETVKASMPHVNAGRIPLSYAHKKERDMFYEVSPSDLPPIIRQNLHPRHKPKVRVTVDQRTGEILAKIVKCRVADLDVYSPRTHVDWRLSINLEISYEGDVSHLPMVDATSGRGGERNKDRMSYRHLAYQVDLTQVAKSEPPTKGDFDHELEIEVSAAEIRRQGQLAMGGDPENQYEDLVKGFVDNVRVLARAVPP